MRRAPTSDGRRRTSEAQHTSGGQGNLVKRTLAYGCRSVYIGGFYEKHSDGTYVKYYSAFGRRMAMRDSAGVVAGTMKYYPYGATRSTTGSRAHRQALHGPAAGAQAGLTFSWPP